MSTWLQVFTIGTQPEEQLRIVAQDYPILKLLGIASLSGLFNLYYFLRGFESFSVLVCIILEILYDIRAFMGMILFGTLAFTVAIRLLIVAALEVV